MAPFPWTALAENGDLSAAREALRSALEQGNVSLFECARAAENLGDLVLAMRAWQLILKDHPADAQAWRALATLHDLRGDSARSAECTRRAESGGDDTEPTDETPTRAETVQGPTPTEASDSDLVRFCSLFAGREGVHARMWKNAEGHGYSPVEQTLTPELVRAHLNGAHTLGIYLVRVDDSVTCCCFDLDVTKRAIQEVLGDGEKTKALRRELAEAGAAIQRQLRGLGLDPLFVDSGWKGRHFWCFFPSPVSAAQVLAWGTAMRAGIRPNSPRLALEFFPKQAAVSRDGLGNLVKLPFALHLVSGRRATILDDSGAPHAQPWERIRSLSRREMPTPPDGLPIVAQPLSDSAPFAPAPGPTDWTEADFDASPEVGPIFRGCPVVRSIVETALRDRRISHEEAVVLEHSIGHFPDGVRAVNYVLSKVPGYPQDKVMGSPHRGSAISCQRVRQRVPTHARKVGCDCPLQPRPGQYANPLLHGGDLVPKKPDPTLDDVLDQLARAEDRLRTLKNEVQRFRAAATAGLARVPGRRWGVKGGEWALVDEDGVAVLRWQPE